jgi:hypothetical protein
MNHHSVQRPLALATLTLVIASFVCCTGPTIQGPGNYKIEIHESGGSLMCEVVFSGKLPAPETVDKIVRDALEEAARKNPTKDILATAFLGDENLTDNQYSGKLVYTAATKTIQTMDDYHGVKKSTSATSSYFVETREDDTYPGITPAEKWLTISIVYPKPPSRTAAYDAIIAEIQKAAGRGLDVNAFVRVGDKNVPTSWEQMRDDDGAYVFAGYKAATKQITRKGALLKTLP